jgi:hypothetical protein
MGKDWLNYMLSSFAASQRLLLHSCVDYFSADSKSLKISLVEHFKFFGEKIGEKCPFFFTHFSLKKWVKNSKLFQHFFE